MWNVIITLTTTGYGDIYPKTNLGRFVGLILCFWGTFVVSFFVVTVNNMLTFTPQEEKSYTLLLRLHFKDQLKKYAVNVLSAAYQNRNAQLNNKDDQGTVIQYVRRYRAASLSFQQAVARVRSFYDGDTDSDILMRIIENLKEEVDQVKLDQEVVNESLLKVCTFIDKLDERQKLEEGGASQRSGEKQAIRDGGGDTIKEESEEESFTY